jgi:hypothetical protein
MSFKDVRIYGTNGREEELRVYERKPEGKRPLGIPGHRWEDNIKMGLSEIRWRVWSEFIWLKIEACAGLLCTRNVPSRSLKC